jgi:ELWxxDGT repeat protein
MRALDRDACSKAAWKARRQIAQNERSGQAMRDVRILWVIPLAVGISVGAALSVARAEPLPGKVLFLADDGLRGYRPYVTDGTSDGTKLIRLPDYSPLVDSSLPEFHALPGKVAMAWQTGNPYRSHLRFVDREGVLGPELGPSLIKPRAVQLPSRRLQAIFPLSASR